MGKQKIVNRRGKYLLTNQLGKFERLHQEEMNILVNGTVPGLAPLYVQWKRKTAVLTVDASHWIPLSAYFRPGMDARSILKVLWYCVSIAYDCERHGLRIDNLCWDWNCVFVDGKKTVWMVYWPVTTLTQVSAGPLNFFAGFYQYFAESGVDQELLHQYGQYFYQRTQFDFHKFYAVVTDIYAKWRVDTIAQNQKQNRQGQQEENDALRSNRLHRISGIWLEDTKTGERHSLSPKQHRIGRDDAWADLVLKNYEGVSRRHAVISATADGRFVITDLGSANGTFVEGQRIRQYKQIPLSDGNRLRFGSARFLFRQTDLNQTISIHQLHR